jgi:hypothetical protein
MKQFKMYLVLVLIAFVAFGCSKTPTETETTPAPTTTALPATQQTAAASVATTNATASIEGTDDMAGGLSSGNFSPSFKKGGKTPPDTFWTLGADGWYFYSNDNYYYLDTVKVKFTPDIWASAAPYPQATKVEYKYYYDTTTTNEGGTVTSKFLYTGLCQRADTLSLIVSGNYNYNYTYNINYTAYTMDLSYLWNFSFDNVNVTYSDQTGHYTWSCTYPFVNEATPTTISHTSLTGEMKFDANGYGNLGADGYAGWCATEGTIFVKYYSTSTEKYYTLAGDGFTAHITWSK